MSESTSTTYTDARPMKTSKACVLFQEPASAAVQRILSVVALSYDVPSSLVARYAYELWQNSSFQSGRDLDNWLQAEQAIKEKLALSAGY